MSASPRPERLGAFWLMSVRAIRIDLKGLNEEAAELAARIARNFEELGA
jgi:hypothetical protein